MCSGADVLVRQCVKEDPDYRDAEHLGRLREFTTDIVLVVGEVCPPKRIRRTCGGVFRANPSLRVDERKVSW